MSDKAKRIISWILIILPSLMLLMSAVMKLMHAEPVATNLTKGGFGNLITALGLIELVSVVLLLIPKTYKIGFLLVVAYLGGAIAIELGSGQFPAAAVFMTLVWIGIYLRNKLMFVQGTAN